ncbi:hypothetical protein V8F33_011211 [Rhypophila sp. PSN 637]
MAIPCYRANGTRDETLLACNPSDDTSPCCRANDLCLSNGLCLNLSDGDNGYSTQGCTDPKWGAPCLSRCGDQMLESGLDMWPYYLNCCSCHSVWMSPGSLPEYCCWRGDKCCGGPETRFQLPLFKAASKPAGIPASAATNAPDIGAGGGSADQNGSDHPKVLGIGLGLGLGLGLLLLASGVAFFTMSLRRRRKQDYHLKSDSVQNLAQMSLTRPGSRTTHSALSIPTLPYNGSNTNTNTNTNNYNFNTNNPPSHLELHSNPHILQPPGSAGVSSGPAAVREQGSVRVQSAIMLPTEPAAVEMPVPSNNRFPYISL